MNHLNEYRNLPWMDRSSGYLQSGRVLVRVEDSQGSRIDFCNWENTKLPAYLIHLVLRIMLGAQWAEKLEHLHRNRGNQWQVDICENSSGAKEYRLYTLEDNQPVCSSLMTVADSCIETFSIYSEDAAPLLKKIIEDYPPVYLRKYRNCDFNFFPNFYPYPADKKYLKLPEPIVRQREATRKLNVNPEVLSAEKHSAGEPSGIIETIAALKCLEVLMA